ncbi:MAG: cbb3-type cytochrome oxidase assembly protein CcoS [Gallionellaceae bacterium]|jgi:cbb3-type cytochrome oxidase maturation protein
MEILYLLVPISVLLAFAFGLVFWWALNHRQFDALDEAASRILEDSDQPADPTAANQPSAHAK